MRMDAVFKKTATFEYWSPVITFDAALNKTITFTDGGLRKGVLIPAGSGTATLITTEQMTVDGEVRNLTDAAGNVVFMADDTPYIMFISSADPIFGLYGVISGWKHTIKRAATLAEEILDTL